MVARRRAISPTLLLRGGRVGKIAQPLAIIIPVDGNFAHPTPTGFMESVD
jgi:hypothetical protein